MRRSSMLSSLLVVAVAAGCTEREAVAPMEFEASFSVQGPVGQNFNTHMTGDEEVPAVDTRAQGQTNFQLNRAETELSYHLNVANIQNVTQAHIHCGAAGVNGPVVLWLYPSAPPATLIPGRSSGVLNRGTATAEDVVARPDSDACPGGVANFAELVEKMRTGEAYVNVHTSQFPPGEIRGQINPRGPQR
jgi:hypothetical protein